MRSKLRLAALLMTGICLGAVMYDGAMKPTPATADPGMEDTSWSSTTNIRMNSFQPFKLGKWTYWWISYNTLHCQGENASSKLNVIRESDGTFDVKLPAEVAPTQEEEDQVWEDAGDLQREFEDHPELVPPSPFSTNTGGWRPWLPGLGGDPWFIVPPLCKIVIPLSVAKTSVTQTVRIDWGDGTVSSYQVPAGSGTDERDVTHFYPGSVEEDYIMQPGDYITHDWYGVTVKTGSKLGLLVVKHPRVVRTGTGSEDGG